jgi:hypothetical protein
VAVLRNLTDGDPDMVRGVFTTEFAVAVIAFVVASILLVLGSITEETWNWMASGSVVAYIVSRGIAKS